MKGANGFGMELGEKLCSSVWLAIPTTSWSTCPGRTHPEFAHEKISEYVEAG